MTEAAKHTPGPWEAIGGNIFPCNTSQLATDGPVSDGVRMGGLMYAVATVKAPERWRDGSAIGVLEANARLIAAAPEMLATLKWLCEQMQAEQDAGVSGFDDWMSPARAIIVKAEQA